MKNRNLFKLAIAICIVASFPGCVSLAEYQKMLLNDPDMALSESAIESFEQGFVTYREGVSGGNGGKTGGGCGCN
jgi:hypothetical protein